MFPLLLAWVSCWTNSWVAGDLGHSCEVIVSGNKICSVLVTPDWHWSYKSTLKPIIYDIYWPGTILLVYRFHFVSWPTVAYIDQDTKMKNILFRTRILYTVEQTRQNRQYFNKVIAKGFGYQLTEAEWHIYTSVNLPSLVQIMACRLAGAKPLSEPMLEYWELNRLT